MALASCNKNLYLFYSPWYSAQITLSPTCWVIQIQNQIWFCLGSSFQANSKRHNLAQATPSVVVGHSYQIKRNLKIICSQDDKELEVSQVSLTLFWLLFNLLVSGGEKVRACWERKQDLGILDLFSYFFKLIYLCNYQRNNFRNTS